jgi:catechol 2,3-dioxygenase-like lactoylglutathione lyase family enzyme
MITGIAHVNLTVPPGTLEQAAEFYGNTLGFTRVAVPALQKDSLAWYLMLHFLPIITPSFLHRDRSYPILRFHSFLPHPVKPPPISLRTIPGHRTTTKLTNKGLTSPPKANKSTFPPTHLSPTNQPPLVTHALNLRMRRS